MRHSIVFQSLIETDQFRFLWRFKIIPAHVVCMLDTRGHDLKHATSVPDGVLGSSILWPEDFPNYVA